MGNRRRMELTALFRLIISGALLSVVYALDLNDTREILCVVTAAIIAGYDLITELVAGLGRGLDARFLIIAVAVCTLFTDQPRHSALLMIINEAGVLSLRFLLRRSRRFMETQASATPDTASVMENGAELNVPVESVAIGSTIIIRPGESAPLDCIILQGRSALDMSHITGETSPLPVDEDSFIPAGAVNLSSPFTAEVVATAANSTSERVLRTINSMTDKKGKSELAFMRISGIFTPMVVLSALILAVAIPLTTRIPVGDAILRALAMLAAGGSGALSVCIPVTFSAGIYGAARRGMIFKSSQAMDSTALASAAVFDKTGTLTTGNYRVTSIKTSGRMDSDMLLRVAAHAEAYSVHPIAKSIIAAYGGAVYIELVQHFNEYPGRGVTAVIDGIAIVAGGRQFLSARGVEIDDEEVSGQTAVFLSVGGVYAGRMLLSDTIKNESAEAVRYLSDLGCETIAMVSGDRAELSGHIARQCGINTFYPDCLPDDKIAAVAQVRARSRGTLIAIAGGEDPSVFPQADVRIKMCGLGSESTAGLADVIIMSDNPGTVGTAMFAAQSTRNIALQNAAIVLCVKLAVVVFAGVGFCNIWTAALVDALLCALTTPSAMRAYKIGQ